MKNISIIYGNRSQFQNMTTVPNTFAGICTLSFIYGFLLSPDSNFYLFNQPS
jgi:hypothetical protein